MKQICPNCDIKVTSEIMIQQFPYLHGTDKVTIELSAVVNVWTCSTCEFAWTDGEAEIARQTAVATYLNQIPE